MQLLMKKKERQDKTQIDHHEVNLIELQCNFNSDLEEDDLFFTFEYQVLSAVLCSNLRCLEYRARDLCLLI